MLVLIILFIFLIVLAIWVVANLGIVVIIPALVAVSIGPRLGLNWWQSLLVTLLTLAVVQVLIERYYAWHFRKHAAELDLPIELLGRQIEVEGKLATILGTTGNKIVKVVTRKKGEAFATKIDPHLARTKAGL